MNTEGTKEKLRKMKLTGIHRAYEAILTTRQSDGLTLDESIAYMTDAEWEDRYNRRLSRLITQAKFRFPAELGKVEYKKDRELDKNQIMRLSDCSWIHKGESIIITGSTGAGKSFMSCALGQNACINSHKVIYFNCMKIFSELKKCKADGSYAKEMNRIKKQDLVILDDFGLQQLDAQSRLIMLELLEDRYGNNSTIITSQLPINEWHNVIGEPTIADAICDRLVHNSHRIDIKGDSMRRKKIK